MLGVVNQRSSPAVTNAASVSRFSDRTAFICYKSHGQSCGFQKKWLDTCLFSRQSTSNEAYFVVKAGAATNGSRKPFTPLQPESPTGQFLMELLQSHPHLFPVAAEQQLEMLAEQKKAAENQNCTPGTDLVLYKRIAELKAQERRTAVEEIIYALVSQRFIDARIYMVHSIPLQCGEQKIDNWPSQDKELKSIHSDEALDMVWEHVAFILGVKDASKYVDSNTTVQISKLHMGQVYATSAVYGYFLKRVDEKFQMEKTMNVLSPSLGEVEDSLSEAMDTETIRDDDFTAEVVSSISAMMGLGSMYGGISTIKSRNLLRNYVMSFDPDTLYRCATIRSIEIANIIEKHTEALFGKPNFLEDSIAVKKDDAMILSLPGFKRLVLEAVAFGSFLWDSESYVDSYYSIVVPNLH